MSGMPVWPQFRDMDVLTDFRQVAERKVTELMLTVDDAGLFSRVAGAVAGLINIIGARITTCRTGPISSLPAADSGQ